MSATGLAQSRRSAIVGAMRKAWLLAFATVYSLNASCSRDACDNPDERWCEGQVVYECQKGESHVSINPPNRKLLKVHCASQNLSCVEHEGDAWCSFTEDVRCKETRTDSCYDGWRASCQEPNAPIRPYENCAERELVCILAENGDARCVHIPCEAGTPSRCEDGGQYGCTLGEWSLINPLCAPGLPDAGSDAGAP
jgi:hypothetical protein